MNPVSVVLIVHNEAETIAHEVESYYKTIVTRIPGSELIVAEDGSTDGTGEILRDIKTRIPIKLIQGKDRKGYKKALLDAFSLPSLEWVMFSDTGGKFDPSDFWKLEPYLDEADLIIGLRENREDQIYRRLLTKIFNILVNIYFGISLRDIDSGFRVFRKELVLSVISAPLILDELISTELTLRMIRNGARVVEVPVKYHQRKGLSRGLPVEKIPRVVFHVICKFPLLKKEMKGRGS